MTRIKAEVIRSNDYGLVVIQDRASGQQYAVTNERVKTLPIDQPWQPGTKVDAAVQDGVVVEASKAPY